MGEELQLLVSCETIHFHAQIKAHFQGVLILFSASFMVKKYLSYLSESQYQYDGGNVGEEGLGLMGSFTKWTLKEMG